MKPELSDLTSVQSTGYNSESSVASHGLPWGIPNLTMEYITQMLADEQVKLGCKLICAPLLSPKIEIEGNPEAADFARETFNRLWLLAVPKLLDGLFYSVAGGECVYASGDDGRLRFESLLEFSPNDIELLVKDNAIQGMQISAKQEGNDGKIFLWGMKCLPYIHQRKNGCWQGTSELKGAFPAWLEKTGPKGSEHARRMWFYRNSFHSGTMYHPPGFASVMDANNNIRQVSWQSIAQKIGESISNGGFVTIENIKDDQGNSLWEIEKPGINGDGGVIINNCDHVDRRITRGMGIPDDILTQTSGTGSYAGRSMPMMAFFKSTEKTLLDLVMTCDQFVVRNLVRLNLNRSDYQITGVSVDTDALMPSGPSAGAANDATGNSLVSAAVLSGKTTQASESSNGVASFSAWDESKVNRHPSGTSDGGKFAPKYSDSDPLMVANNEPDQRRSDAEFLAARLAEMWDDDLLNPAEFEAYDVVSQYAAKVRRASLFANRIAARLDGEDRQLAVSLAKLLDDADDQVFDFAVMIQDAEERPRAYRKLVELLHGANSKLETQKWIEHSLDEIPHSIPKNDIIPTPWDDPVDQWHTVFTKANPDVKFIRDKFITSLKKANDAYMSSGGSIEAAFPSIKLAASHAKKVFESGIKKKHWDEGVEVIEAADEIAAFQKRFGTDQDFSRRLTESRDALSKTANEINQKMRSLVSKLSPLSLNGGDEAYDQMSEKERSQFWKSINRAERKRIERGGE